MGTVLNSFDKLIASSQTNGGYPQFWLDRATGATTAATTTSGYVTARRFTRSWSFASVGAGLTGAVMTKLSMMGALTSTTNLAGIEYSLGVHTINGGSGSFVAGSTMPVKTDPGNRTTTVQTAAGAVFGVVTTVLVGTAPTLTITYVNQAGVGSRTATMTLPAASTINSAFYVYPHLQSGDTGIQQITAVSSTASTSGVVTFYGLLTLGLSNNYSTSGFGTVEPLIIPSEMWKIEPNEKVSFYVLHATTATDMCAMWNLVAED